MIGSVILGITVLFTAAGCGAKTGLAYGDPDSGVILPTDIADSGVDSAVEQEDGGNSSCTRVCDDAPCTITRVVAHVRPDDVPLSLFYLTIEAAVAEMQYGDTLHIVGAELDEEEGAHLIAGSLDFPDCTAYIGDGGERSRFSTQIGYADDAEHPIIIQLGNNTTIDGIRFGGYPFIDYSNSPSLEAYEVNVTIRNSVFSGEFYSSDIVLENTYGPQAEFYGRSQVSVNGNLGSMNLSFYGYTQAEVYANEIHSLRFAENSGGSVYGNDFTGNASWHSPPTHPEITDYMISLTGNAAPNLSGDNRFIGFTQGCFIDAECNFRYVFAIANYTPNPISATNNDFNLTSLIYGTCWDMFPNSYGCADVVEEGPCIQQARGENVRAIFDGNDPECFTRLAGEPGAPCGIVDISDYGCLE